jgi:hypothetical protein
MRTAFAIAGVILLLAVPAPWLIGSMFVLAVGPSETVSVRETGMITCPEVLTWTEWSAGPGPVRRTEADYRPRIDPNAEIVEYRIGQDAKGFMELTFYQAKYRFPDGTIVIAPAHGPKPLVGVNDSVASTYAFVSGGIGIACLLLACWFFPTQVEERAERDSR